jgi:hypothetical protein
MRTPSTLLQIASSPAARLPRPAERWNADRYLAEYYSRLEHTEQHTLRFLVDALHGAPPVGRALDFGAGPTLHHAMALAACTRELHIADLLPDNLRAILRWLRGAPGAHDWSAHIREVLRLEGRDVPNDAQVAERAALLRRCTTRVLTADARRADPLGNTGGGYGCVTSFFCADSATRDFDEWRRCVRNIAGLLAPGGLLVMGALRCCTAWRLGNTWLPAACIDVCHLQFVLDSAGFDQSERRIEIVEVPDQRANGFESILLVSARARRGGA